MSKDNSAVPDEESEDLGLGLDDESGNTEADSSSEDNSETGNDDELLDEYDNESGVESELGDEDDDEDDNVLSEEEKTYKQRYANSTKAAQKLLKEKKDLEKLLQDAEVASKNQQSQKGDDEESKPNSINNKVLSTVERLEAEANQQKIQFLVDFEKKHSEIKFNKSIRKKIAESAEFYKNSFGHSKEKAYEKAAELIRGEFGIKKATKPTNQEIAGASLGGGVNFGQMDQGSKEDVSSDEMQEVFDKIGKSHLGPKAKKSKV